MLHKIFTTLIFLIVFGLLQAKTINVPADQPTIQAGINVAVDGDTVLVADNTYIENINFNGKAITVASYFLVDGDTTHINNTIVDGSQPSHPDSGSVVFFISGEDTTSILCGFTITGGTGTMCKEDSRAGGGILCLNSGALIEHNIIQINAVNSEGRAFGGGYGSYPLSKNFNVVILRHNTIMSNAVNGVTESRGGGVFMVHGKVLHNRITHNTNTCTDYYAEGGGIGCHCMPGTKRPFVEIVDNTITENVVWSKTTEYSALGAGVEIAGINVHIIRNIITHNIARCEKMSRGGGIHFVDVRDSCLVQDNTISFNSLEGTSQIGGGINMWQVTGMTIENNRFESNSSFFGGGLSDSYGLKNVIKNNKFINNKVSKAGGGMDYYASNDSIINNTFIGNESGSTGYYGGGGIYVQDSNSGFISRNTLSRNKAFTGWGGGMCSRNSNLTITHNIFTNNSAYGGGAMGMSILENEKRGEYSIINNTITENSSTYGSGIACKTVVATIKNNIVWNNKGGKQILNDMPDGTVIVSYSDIQGGQEGVNNLGNSVLIWQDGNIDADPLFADSENYYLGENSPCVDAGDSADGHCDECIDGAAIWPAMGSERSDMGAYGGMKLITDVRTREDVAHSPIVFSLLQNYPNPFNPATTIDYELPYTAQVKLVVYDMLGRQVKQLVNEQKTAGQYSIVWDGTNEVGESVAAGLYFCRMEAEGFTVVIKLALVK